MNKDFHIREREGISCPNLEGRFATLDATRIAVSRSNGQRSELEAGGAYRVDRTRPQYLVSVLFWVACVTFSVSMQGCLLLCNSTGNGYIYHYETFRINRQWHLNYEFKFARWQHPAMGRGASFVVHGTTCFSLLIILNEMSTYWFVAIVIMWFAVIFNPTFLIAIY